MLRFGVAGYPLAFTRTPMGRSRHNIMRWLSDLGLSALELQMTYGPRTKVETCRDLRQIAAEYGITLSVHASYFIVLTSPYPDKIRRSIDTLKTTCDLAEELGASVVVLHPGSIYGGIASAAQDRFLTNASTFLAEYGTDGAGVFIETAGKLGQLGSVNEILDISAGLANIHPCIDFGHVHARTLGTLSNRDAIDRLGLQIDQFLAAHSQKRIHFHFTPIHYGPRGEIQHRAIDDRYPTDPEDLFARDAELFHPRPENVAPWLKAFQGDATVISETHNSQEQGALALKAAATLSLAA